MARGWESKSVEDQVQEFQAKSAEHSHNKLTSEEAKAARDREVRMLSLARVRSALESCQDPRYREQLSRALADLEAQIAEDSPQTPQRS